ncbi:conserved hypothetical protein [Ricinus communis]|uniref:Secreted protein n=1 Tax=Ricinus communis TaxID=3988 RepID=B9TFY1_RICCO|nr:conserved hypothetical protein [Ricinus communis]
MAAAWSALRLSIAALTRWASCAPLRMASGWAGSSASRLRAIVKIQAAAEARAGSKRCALRQTASRVSWASSSAAEALTPPRISSALILGA